MQLGKYDPQDGDPDDSELCDTMDEDILCPSCSWQLLANNPWPGHHERTGWHNLAYISIYSPYLFGLNNRRETDTSKRNQAHGESKWAIRASSRYVKSRARLVSLFAAASRTFGKRHQDKPNGES